MLTKSSITVDQLQGRLISLAAVFLSLYSLALTLSPAAYARSWQVEFRWLPWLGFSVWLVVFVILHRETARLLPSRDPYLLPVGALLSGWGLMTIWRLFPTFGGRQTLWLVICLGVFSLALRIPDLLDVLRRYKYLWLTSGLVLTGLTLMLGTNPASETGPRLWLGCCGFYFQPSEPLKLLMVVYLAAYLADRLLISPDLLPLLAPTLFMTGLALLLLVVQRDLGTVTIFIFLYTTVVYLATRRLRILVVGALILAISGVGGYVLFDVVRLRIDAWLNPWLDPSGRSYQIVQSLLAVANGGLFGRGPGLGNPALVPIPHSDFIFSAIAEETGLMGVFILLSVLAMLAGHGLGVALRAPDNFKRYLAAGVSAHLVGQSVLIIGGNLRLLPLTGVTLPFVSYGGSSLMTAFVSLFILLRISDQADNRTISSTITYPYLQLGGFLFAGLAVIGLATGWWSIYRGPAILERTDNPRRAIADRYVRRGSLLDRREVPLAISTGAPGELERKMLYPPLGAIIGYTHPTFGQSGLEASLDPYLRGLVGNPGLTIWWNHLLYGQPPPGLDVRLTLNLDSQSMADEMLGDIPSALVMINARSGEILAMASHPTFDPNLLDTTWEELVNDVRAPLFNRATLGLYPPGTSLGAFLLAEAMDRGELPALPQRLTTSYAGMELTCALGSVDQTWESAVASGCPATQEVLGRSLGSQALLDLYKNLGLYTAPSIRLPTSAISMPETFDDPKGAYLGQSGLSVNPLQMAVAAAGLSNAGNIPAPRLAASVNTPRGGWVILPSLREPHQAFPAETVKAMVASLAVERLPIWQVVASTPNGPGKSVTWYLGGTLPSWGGAPLSIAIVLEENNPQLVDVIGRAILQSALQP